MPLKALNPDDFPDIMASGRGRVTHQICQEFLASGMKLAQLDMNDFPGRKPAAMSSSLNAFISRHELPMKNKRDGQDIYVWRTDIDEDGNVEKKDIKDYVTPAFSIPIGKAGQELIDRKDIPTLSVGTARERLAEENEGPE